MSLQSSLIDYTLHLADNALILGHRNSEWTGHGPILEQDIAISNIALDMIGQARNFYQFAAKGGEAAAENAATNGKGMFAAKEVATVDKGETAFVVTGAGEEKGNPGVTEDVLAFHRDAWDYKNCLLVEQPNGDWATTILRQFFFSNYQFCLYEKLQSCKVPELAAIAEKSYKEVMYHLRWSSEWVIRLGDGTDESHARMKNAMELLWQFTGELFIPAPYEVLLVQEGLIPDLTSLRGQWEEKTKEIFSEAGLSFPESTWMQSGGKEGRHTEELGYLLAEMQFLQRAYPGCEW